MTVSRRFSTRSTVEPSHGADFETTVKTATVPCSSRVGGPTSATSPVAPIAFCRPGSAAFASFGLSNSEAIRSGPIRPGPKPSASAS